MSSGLGYDLQDVTVEWKRWDAFSHFNAGGHIKQAINRQLSSKVNVIKRRKSKLKVSSSKFNRTRVRLFSDLGFLADAVHVL